MDASTLSLDDVFPYTTRNMDSGRFSYRVSSSSSRFQVQLEFGDVTYHVPPAVVAAPLRTNMTLKRLCRCLLRHSNV